jgi:hypothetical protein
MSDEYTNTLTIIKMFLMNLKLNNMKTQLKTTIITALLLFASVSGLVAQDKQEYGMITAQYYQLTITTGIETVVTKATKGEDFEIAQMKALNKMASEGWEVYNTTEQYDAQNGRVVARTFFLKRKAKE